ncbi:MAG: cobyric acid synthase [Chlorobi bacterium]|nr:cobyric acid synthase [Chlorobiota bacterium]
MFVGTGSDVGKSIINAAFCRIFVQDGYNPAPFKAQNMSLNSFVTKDGAEIGRAQAVQAEASGIKCNEHMNPILLKPSGEKVSQLIVRGKPKGNKSAYEYFSKGKNELFQIAIESFKKLEEKYNPIVMEGAGSISELNLKSKDIVNMNMALATDANVFLIADIDRGGVFGSVYGTLELLEKQERKLIKGIIINKFKGDVKLFEEGRKKLEEITKTKVVGIIPYFDDIYIDDEDSVSLARVNKTADKNKINIAVVLLKHISNFTDFAPFEKMQTINLYYAQNSQDIEDSDIIIIPGSKNTISDMLYLKKTGLDKAILKAVKNNKVVIGICGGYQIMGEFIEDPHNVEGNIEKIPGLGILPVTTILSKEKSTKQVEFYYKNYKEVCKGYEIHMGETKSTEQKPVNHLVKGGEDGFMLNEKCFGTYMHGIFDNNIVLQDILSFFDKNAENINFEDFKQKEYDRLADLVRQNVDMEYVYEVLKD